MLRNLFRHRKSISFVWFISYFAVLIIPLIASGILFSFQMKQTEEQVRLLSRKKLEAPMQKIDAWANFCYTLSYKISTDQNVFDLIANKTSSEQLSKYFIRENLNNYKVTSSSIKEILIYLKDDDSIISTELANDGYSYYTLYHNAGFSGSYSDFEKYYQENTNGKFIAVPKGDGYDIAYMVTHYAEREDTAGFNLIFFLDEEDVTKSILENASESTADFLIVDENDNIIFSANGIWTGHLRGKNLEPNKQGEIRLRNPDNKEYILFSSKSVVNGWRYFYASPVRTYMSNVTTMRVMVFVSLILSVALGVVIIAFMVRRNYKPVEEILNVLKINTAGNEYRHIQESITRVLGENDKYGLQLDKQQQIMQAKVLEQLVKTGFTGNIPLEEALENYDILFIGETFGLLMFYVEDAEKLFEQEKNLSPVEKDKTTKFILTNVMTELACQNALGYTFETGELLVCLVNFRDSVTDEEAKGELYRIAREGQQFIADNFQVYFTTAISNIQRSYTTLCNAYQEAFDALEYRLIRGINSIIPYSEIVRLDGGKTNYYYPLESEQRLINSIISGDKSRAETMVEEILEHNIANQMSLQSAKLLVFDLVGTMAKAMGELRISDRDNVVDGTEALDDILNCRTIAEAKKKTLELLEVFCKSAEEKKSPAQLTIINSAKEYVRQHYTEPELSIGSIADYFNITPNYLSHAFKEHSGDGLLAYIHFVRIEHAKQLLLDDRHASLDQIAVQVGYTNTSTFSRVFIKREGATPKRWAESKRNNQRM